MLRLLSFFLCLTLTSCSYWQKKDSSSLQLCFKRRISSLDPIHGWDPAIQTVNHLLFAKLMRFNEKDQAVCWLASRVDKSKDEKTYTITLRKSFWSDGSVVRAQDFIHGWKRLLASNEASFAKEFFYPIAGAKEIIENHAPVEQLQVRALKDDTLQICLHEPYPYFEEILCLAPLSPFKKEGLFCGAFQPTFYDKDKLTLKQNPHYIQKHLTKIKEISIGYIPSEITLYHLYEKGEIDWMGLQFAPIPTEYTHTLKSRLDFHQRKAVASSMLYFETSSKIFQSLSMRKAFAAAIDRRQLVKTAAYFLDIPSASPLTEALSQLPTPSFKEDPKKLFAQGLKELNMKKEELPPLLLFGNTYIRTALIESIQHMWQKAFGISVKIQRIEPKLCMEAAQKKKHDAYIGYFFPVTKNALTFWTRFTSPEGLRNFSHWKNERLQNRLQAPVASFQDWKEKIRDLENLCIQDGVITGLYHLKLVYLQQPHLQNVTITSQGIAYFDRAEKIFHE